MAFDPDGKMTRRRVVLFGYRKGCSKGPVETIDDEVLGSWFVDDEEWCHFVERGDIEVTASAPSSWQLHDRIADRLDKDIDVNQ